MKIQLKRSNVLEAGAAKKPTAGQMEYGELAVNYNTNDTAIFLKDSADQIVRVGGFKAGDNIEIDGDGNISADASYWEEGTDVLYPKTLTNNVGIGGSVGSHTINLSVDGSANFAVGNITFDVDRSASFASTLTTPHFDLESLPPLPATP